MLKLCSLLLREKSEAKRGSDLVTQKKMNRKSRRNCVHPGTVFFLDGTYQQLHIKTDRKSSTCTIQNSYRKAH